MRGNVVLSVSKSRELVKFLESKIRDRQGTQFLNGHFNVISSCSDEELEFVELFGVVVLLELTCDPETVVVAFFLQGETKLVFKSPLIIYNNLC